VKVIRQQAPRIDDPSVPALDGLEEFDESLALVFEFEGMEFNNDPVEDVVKPTLDVDPQCSWHSNPCAHRPEIPAIDTSVYPVRICKLVGF
jgi:hypothetical protein